MLPIPLVAVSQTRSIMEGCFSTNFITGPEPVFFPYATRGILNKHILISIFWEYSNVSKVLTENGYKKLIIPSACLTIALFYMYHYIYLRLLDGSPC